MLRWFWIWMVLLLTACGRQEELYAPTFSKAPPKEFKEYIVGVHPLHNPKRLMQVYGPIIEHANLKMPEVRFRLEPARNYEEFDRKLYAGYYDLAMPNPYQTVHAFRYGYRVFAKMGDDDEFRGIILVRKDGNIHQVSDLKGKTVVYPAQTALAASMLPQYFLHTHGVDVNLDIRNRYVGSQESSILNVLRGHAAAAATWPVPWKAFSAAYPEMADQLEVKWQTEPLINNSWVARSDVPENVRNKFRDYLLSLHESSEGRKLLARVPISRFESADNDTYLPVIAFLESFSKNVREVEW